MKHCLDIIVAALVLSGLTACMNLPEANSKKPDEVLFVHAVGAIQRQKQAVAQISLQTLLNTYPDSEYAPKAKVLLDELGTKCAETAGAGDECKSGEASEVMTFMPAAQ